MENGQKRRALLICVIFLGLAYQVLAKDSLDEQKNYYPPDPHSHSPRALCACTDPSHSGSSTPSHRPPTPPPTLSHHGGGYYNNPPSGHIVPTPPTPSVTPITPTPFVPREPPTPTSPVNPSPPAIPIDPNTPPFTCNYWRTHPTLIWGLLGYWVSIGQMFGNPAVSVFGSNPSVPQALANTRTDGYGALYREGAAAMLNSMATKNFVFTTHQVKASFNHAIASNGAAAAQAQLFKKANDRHLKH